VKNGWRDISHDDPWRQQSALPRRWCSGTQGSKKLDGGLGVSSRCCGLARAIDEE
jgi:hypothetical protein